MTAVPRYALALPGDILARRLAEAAELDAEYRSDGWAVRLACNGHWFAADRRGCRPLWDETAAGLRAQLGRAAAAPGHCNGRIGDVPSQVSPGAAGLG